MFPTAPDGLRLLVDTMQGPHLSSIGIATITDFVRYCDEDVACKGDELVAMLDGG